MSSSRVVAAATLTVIPAGAASRTSHALTQDAVDHRRPDRAHPGTVTPAASDQTVRLQRFYAKAWHSYKEQTLTSASVVQLHGDTHGRRRVPVPHRVGDNVSRTITLSVYAWQDLTSLVRQVHLGDGAGCELSATINGTFFEHTCTFQDVYAIVRKSSVEWTGLQQKCSTFEGTAGLVDSDKDVAKASLSVSADGVCSSTARSRRGSRST